MGFTVVLQFLIANHIELLFKRVLCSAAITLGQATISSVQLLITQYHYKSKKSYNQKNIIIKISSTTHTRYTCNTTVCKIMMRTLYTNIGDKPNKILAKTTLK